MYNANTQNTLLRIRTELDGCSYDPRGKDYLANMIVSVMKFPKKKPQSQARHFIRTMNQSKIIMVWFPMNVPFMGKTYDVPLQIFIMRNIPYEPPQIFLEVANGSAANVNNRDIDPNTNRIMTNTLRAWNQYSNIENAMNEIYDSFSRTFPLYKKSSNPQPAPPANQGASGGGGIYGMLKNEVSNLYQQNNNYYNNQGKGNYGGYTPPTKNIYGRSMTLERNNENQQPSSFGGGNIYGNNNNQQQNSFSGGNIYGNNNNNNQQQSSFSGGNIYGNNNNNQNQPNSFGGGIYDNTNNQQSGGGIYGNTNNQQSGGGIYGNTNNQQGGYGYGAQPPQPALSPEEELKNILINEISNKISGKLIEEKKRVYNENLKLKNYKNTLGQINQKLKNYLNGQNQIKVKCDEDMNNINNAVNRVKNYNENAKNNSMNEENCINFVEIPDPAAIKVIADEAALEEMILVVKKGFERKKISFEEAMMFMRNSARELYAVKFLKEKVLNKYRY